MAKVIDDGPRFPGFAALIEKNPRLKSEAIISLVVLGNSVASGSADQTIKIWYISYKIGAEKMLQHNDNHFCVCVLGNGLIATGSLMEIKIWKKIESNSSLQSITNLTGHTDQV